MAMTISNTPITNRTSCDKARRLICVELRTSPAEPRRGIACNPSNTAATKVQMELVGRLIRKMRKAYHLTVEGTPWGNSRNERLWNREVSHSVSG